MNLVSGCRGGCRASCWAWVPQGSADSQFPTQVGTAAQGILASACRPSHCSAHWRRNHRNIHLEKESKSSDIFPLPPGPEKQAWEFPKFRLSLYFRCFLSLDEPEICESNIWWGLDALFFFVVFVANTGPAKLWGYKKEQGKLHAVGGCFTVWFLTHRKFTFKFWEKASGWF